MEKQISKSVFIEAREWFDKVNGNSYFSARISIDGRVVHALPFQYGYESQFEHEASKWLMEEGYLTSAPSPLWRLRDLGLDVYTVKYSTNKKDAKRFGQIMERY